MSLDCGHVHTQTHARFLILQGCSQGYGHWEVLYFSEEHRILSGLEMKEGQQAPLVFS